MKKAVGRNYFGPDGFPLTAVRVHADRGETGSHPFDLTQVEHNHDFNELVIITRGHAMHRIEGRDQPVTAGDVYILQSRHKHFFYDPRDLAIINIMYEPERLPLPDAELRKMAGYCALFLLEPRYRMQRRFSSRLHLDRVALACAEERAEALLAEADSDQPGREAAMLTHLQELMVYLSRQYQQTREPGGRELLRIGEVIGSMERQYAHNWTLAALCRLAHMSRSNFFRIFQQATGQPPIDYLIHLRIQEAMRRLRNGNDSITEIGLACGFSDGNYFTRQFKKHLGMTPSAYRRIGLRPQLRR